MTPGERGGLCLEVDRRNVTIPIPNPGDCPESPGRTVQAGISATDYACGVSHFGNSSIERVRTKFKKSEASCHIVSVLHPNICLIRKGYVWGKTCEPQKNLETTIKSRPANTKVYQTSAETNKLNVTLRVTSYYTIRTKH